MSSPIRIFISSPGDVIPERRRANLLIEKLAKTYARFFWIEPVLWELEPMLASGHFQDQITPPSETDILVLIVWSRLGTALPPKTATREYHGIDGRVPVTGTEWEFEDAAAAQKLRGAPDLLAYRKQVDPVVSLKDRSAMAVAEEQWDKLDHFWNRWFVNRGEFRAAFAEFADLDSFEAKLESDLRFLIERRVQALRAAGHEPTGATWLAGSPFRGLETYHFEHAAIFFGRSAVTKAAVERLTGNAENDRAFLLILGASGAGKSSLAQAGVLPALTGRGIVPRVGQWRYAVMHPGGNSQGPFAALAEALISKSALPELLASGQDTAALAKHLRAAADDPCFPIVGALNQIESASRARGDLLEIESTRLAIVADQLEELFTAGEVTAAERVDFVRCLDAMARSGRVFVIATMRNDYWHRASETPLLVDMAAGNGRLDLLPPAKDEIVEMIRQPAEAAGLDFESDPTRDVRLDATLSAETEANPGTLPLLSFLLDELYKKDVKDGGRSTLTYASMQQLGGLNGAIANRAEAAFAGLPADVQAALPKVLRTLVTVSRFGADATARVAPMSLFPEGSPERRLVEALLNPQVRLMIAEGDGTEARVRLAHEALITHWVRAKQQIAQDRDDLRTRALVEEALTDWRSADPRAKRGYLMRDPQLANAVDLAGRWHGELDDNTLRFIEASRHRVRLLHRLTMAAAAVFAIVAVVAGVMSYFADRERKSAEVETAHAKAEETRALLNQSRFLVNLADGLRQNNPGTTEALSLEALPDPPRGNTRPYLLDAERSLFASVQQLHERATLRGHTWTISNVVFSPDGRTLLTSSWDHSIRLWDVATRKEKLKLDDNAGAITKASFSPDGRYILAAPNDGTARIFDATTGAVIHRLPGSGDELWNALYSPDGSHIATVANDKSPRLWDANSGQLVATLSGHADNVTLVAFSQDSSIVVTVGDEQVIKAWRVSDGHFLFDISTAPAKARYVVFSPDGRYLAGASEDGSIWLWDAKTGAPVRTMPVPQTMSGSERWADYLAFSPDGERLAATYGDDIARLWQVASGQEVLQLKGHTDHIWSIVYSPNGKLIATASPDKTARVWNAETGREVAVLRGHGSAVRRVAFSPDGRSLATISGQGTNLFDRVSDNTVRIWDIGASLEIAAIREPRHVLVPGAVSSNSGLVAIGDADTTSDQDKLSVPAQLWNAETYEDLRDLRVDGDSVVSAAGSSDGSRIVTLGSNGDVNLWDAATAASAGVYHSGDAAAYMAAFSPDGSSIAVAVRPRNYGSDRHDIVVLRSSGGALQTTLSGPKSDVASLVFSPDGKHLLTTTSLFESDSGFRIWPIDGSAATVVKDDNLTAARFTPDGKTVITADNNNKVQAWQTGTGNPIATWDVGSDTVSTVYIEPGGRVFVRVVSGPDQAVTAHLVDISSGHELTLPVPSDAPVGQVIFAPGGGRFATYSETGRIEVWDTLSGQLRADISTTVAAPRILQFSNSGKLIAIGAADGVIELWDVGSGQEIQKQTPKEPRKLSGHRDAVTSMAFSSGDEQLVSGSADTTARVWDVSTGKAVATLQAHGTSLASVAFVPASRRILTLGNPQPAVTPQQAAIVDADSGKTVATIVVPGEPDEAAAAIQSVTFSKPGDRIFINGSSVFDARTGKLLFRTPSDAGLFIQSAVMSPSGKLVAWDAPANTDVDNAPTQVHIADFDSGNTIRTIMVADKAADALDSRDDTALVFSPDDRYLTFRGHIWSVQTGDEWHDPAAGEGSHFIYSSDGRLLGVVSKEPIAADPLQNAAALSDPGTGKILFTLHTDSGPVSAVAVDPSGKLVATASDGAVKFWDAASGRQTALIDLKPPDTNSLFFHHGVSRMAFSPDGRRLAVAGDQKIRILDVTSRTEVVSAPAVDEVDRLVYSPDGKWIAASNSGMSGEGLLLWDAASLRPVPLPPWPRRNASGTPFAFSPDGRRLVGTSGTGGEVSGTQALVIDISTGNVVRTLRGHNFQVNAIAYSPDGRRIATAAADDKLHLWDADTFAEVILSAGRNTALAFSPDSRTIALAGDDHTISLWSVDAGKLLRKFAGHDDEIKQLWFIGHGSTLVSVGADRTIRIWNVDTGQPIAKIEHRGPITEAAVADNLIVSANAPPGDAVRRFQLAVWDTTERRKLDLQHEQNGSFGVLFSPNGRYLLIVPAFDSQDKALVLYDIAARKRVGALSLDNTLVGDTAAFAPDDNTVLTFGFGDNAYVWRSSDGKPLGSVEGRARKQFADLLNGPRVNKAEFVANGQRFLTYSSNGAIRLWDRASLQLLATISDDDVLSYQTVLDGRRMIEAHRDGSVHISELPGSTQDLVDLACRLLPGPLTDAERQTYALDPTPEHYPCDRRPQQ